MAEPTSVERRVLGLALSGALSPATAQAIVFGGESFVPAFTPLVSADDFGRLGAVTSPVGVTAVSQDPAQE